jgi:hypothetical protein
VKVLNEWLIREIIDMDTENTILNLLKDNIGVGTIRMFFLGDPIWVSQSYLPAIAVVKTAGDTVTGATGVDEETETFQIRVMFSMMDVMGKSQLEDAAHTFLKMIVDGLNPDGTYSTKSIRGILRTHFILSQTDGIRIVDQRIHVDYDILSQGRIENKPGVLTEEAHVSFVTKKLISVSDRNL